MGSLQQTVLGVLCITVAFFFGQYMRTHPSPDAVAFQATAQPVNAGATPSPFGSPFNAPSTAIANAAKTSLPAPSAGFGNIAATARTRSTLAEPTPRALAQPSPRTFSEMVTGLPKSQAAPAPVARQIDIPDFSELAASFDNTPLALSQRSVSRSDRFDRRPQTTDALRADRTPTPPLRGPDLQRSDFVSSRRQTDLRPPLPVSPATPMSSRGGSHPAFTGSPAERVSPPQPMEPYELKQHASTFRQQDFAPQLGRQRDAEATRPVYTDIRPQRLSLAPPEPVDTMLTPEVPDLDVVLPNPAAALNVNDKHVHSYYDTLSVNNGFTREDFQAASSQERTSRRADRSRGFQPITAERINQTEPKSENVSVAKPATEMSSIQRRRSIPFGLNEAGRSELARIRSRQQSNIDLPTDRFSQYTTQTGDTLQSLSVEYYGKPDFYLDIYLANQAVLRNPIQIPAGVQLQIPVYEQ